MTRTRTELLPGGETVVLRPAVEQDAAAVMRMHGRCSLDGLFRRYLTGAPPLSPALQARLLALPVVLLAQHRADVVGMASLAEQDEHVPEVAVLVEDAWQRRGVGSALVDALLLAAAGRGHSQVEATTLPSSAAVHSLLRRLRGGRLAPTFRAEDGLVTVRLHLLPAYAGSGGPRPSALSA